jgi:PAS domain S-box-containing protein
LNEHGHITNYVSVRTDITEQKKLHLKLMTQVEKLSLYHNVISHTNDMVVICKAEPINEPGPKTIFVNKAFEQITGYSKEEVIGKTPRMLQGVDTDRETLDRIRRALENWQPIREEILNYTKSGEPFWNEVSIFPVANAKGWYTHWVSVQRDVTSRKRQEEQLKLALEEAQVALEAKSRFMSIMSHELKTPINGIMGSAQLLEMGGLSADERDDYAHTIIESSQKLTTMINQMMDYVAINKQHFQLAPQFFHLSLLIQKLKDTYQPIAARQNIMLAFNFHGLENKIYLGDKPHIRQMLSTLMDNAFKFTKKGTVFVEVKELEGNANLILLEFSVTDTGIGIQSENLGTIFSPFTQGDRSNTREFGGVGLGLALVKDFAKIMGGSVDVVSSDGLGSRFSFTVQVSPRKID